MVLSAAWCVAAERTDFIERRWMPALTPKVEVLFAPGTSQGYADAIESDGSEEPPAPFTLQSRWSTTATDGSGLTNGDVTTLTWSIAPDGTPIDALGNISGESADDSNLVAYMRGIYNETDTDSDYTDEVWFQQFESVFDRWSELTGINYVYEPVDDGAGFNAFSFLTPGIVGTRGDIRIGGHRIDGNSGVLAYNFYPNNGEMVIDTADGYFNNTSSNSLKLRNVVAHEAGHGLGLRHSVSSDSNFLLEPYATTAFDGPQFDDILGAQRFYGDAFGDNDSIASAADLGTVNVGQSVSVGTDAADMSVLPTETSFVSIDDETETDFFSFNVTDAGSVQVTLTPVGPTYQNGPQGGSQSAFDAQRQSDLTLEIRDAVSGTSLATANATGLGESEVIEFAVSGPGTYVAIASGLTVDAAQMYRLDVSVLPEAVPLQFQRLAPLGGRMSSSESNPGSLLGAGGSQDYQVFLEAGETISAIVTPDTAVTLTAEVVGLTGTFVGAAAGAAVYLPTTAIAVDGTYTIRVTGDGATGFDFSAFRNTSAADLFADTADASEASINESLIQLGSDRFGAIGVSQADVDEFEIDLTGRSGRPIDIVLSGQNGADFAGQTVELLDTDGTTVLATGVSDAVSGGTATTNYDLGILDFIVPTDGFYTIRLTSSLIDSVYGIVVSESLTFDSEANDATANPLRDLTTTRASLGFLDAVTDSTDHYAIDLTANSFVTFNTATIFDNSSAGPANSLDPEIEIIHPDGTTVVASDTNSAPDGKNALVSFTASVSGTYLLRVRATSGAGEYVTETTTAPPPPTGLLLNEIVENPGGAAVTDNPNEYVEIRGPANLSLSGVYLLFVESDSGSTLGVIDSGASHVIDLTGTSIGSNGFLVIVDDANDPYPIPSGTTIVDVPSLDISGGSYTAMLIHVAGTGSLPSGGQDLDVGNDGLDALPAGWTILDDVSVLDGGNSDRAYGKVVFSSDGDGRTEPGATLVDAGAEFANGTIHQVMRVGDSSGTAADDWVAFRHEELLGPPTPDFFIQATTNPAYTQATLITDHLGQSNPVATVKALTTTIADASISEAAGAAATTITITRNSSTVSALTVTLASDDSGEATIPTSVTIPPGQRWAQVSLDAMDDPFVDGTQTVTLTATATGHLAGIETVDVTDNDSAAVTVADVSVIEGGSLLFTVTLDNPVEDPFNVNVTLTDGTATGGVDYDNTPVTLNFAGTSSETQQFTVTTTDDTVFEGGENFTVSLDATHALVVDADTAVGTIDENDPPPPQVESITFDDGSGQRSAIRLITVTFDTTVTVEDGAFVVTAADGTPVTVATALSIVENKTQAVLTFSGSLVDASGSLLDGNYTLTIVDTKITDGSGNSLDGDGDGVAGASTVDSFFRLYGDADGDRDVDLFDFATFRSSFGQSSGSPGYEAGMDQDGDGDIDLFDFAGFRSNFGAALPPSS
jgi:serralysin